MIIVNKYLPFVLANIMIVIVGVIYNTAFEILEAEIIMYGQIAILIGLALFLLIPIFKNRFVRYAGMLIYFFLGFIQIPPIFMWLQGYLLTDKQNAPVESRLYFLPHLIVLCLSFWCVYSLLKYNKPDRSLDN